MYNVIKSVFLKKKKLSQVTIKQSAVLRWWKLWKLAAWNYKKLIGKVFNGNTLSKAVSFV